MSNFPSTDVNPTKISTKQDDFVLLCGDADSSDAVGALYFLPDNFKLTILSDDAAAKEGASWMKDGAVRGRVRYESNGVAQAASFVDAVLTNAQSEATADVPSVPMGSPEAIASAVLRLSRANA